MAEANVMEVEMVDFQGGSIKYFCHQCLLEINPKQPGLTCPLCNSGFIEEVSENLQRDQEGATSALPNVTDQILMDLLTSQPLGSGHSNDDDDDDEDDDGEVWSRSRNSISSLSSASRRRSHRGRERGLPLHSFIESVLDSLRDGSYQRFGNEFSEPRLRRYGRDFRRTYGGLEDLFTQILTQLTASGPEPATQAQIDELPILAVKQHHLDNSAQCSICLENFVVHEEVTSLPCSHLHHRYCIIPWLQQHATCPVCRHVLTATSPEPKSTGSPFRVTDRSDLLLEPEDLPLFRAPLEELEPPSLNLSVHPPWDVIRLPGLDNPDSAESLNLTSTPRRVPSTASATSASDFEMVNLDNNNVAMDVAFDENIAIGMPFTERHWNHEAGITSSDFELPTPASMLTCIKDIEVAESEIESDL